MFASLTALRFLISQSTLKSTVLADSEYFDCIHRADQQLIARGIQVRSQQQSMACSKDPSLAWFCDGLAAAKDRGVQPTSTTTSGTSTLGVFEGVNLNIFLRDLDADDRERKDQDTNNNKVASLVELERQRCLVSSAGPA